MAPKKSNAPTDLYIPSQQYRWLWFEREGGDEELPELKVRVRADLTIDEVEPLIWEGEKPIEEVRDLIAPFITDWNVATVDEDGAVVKADPPSVAGGEALRLINPVYTRRILSELQLRSTGMVKAAFLPRSKRMAPSDGATTTSGPNGTGQA